MYVCVGVFLQNDLGRFLRGVGEDGHLLSPPQEGGLHKRWAWITVRRGEANQLTHEKADRDMIPQVR